MQTIVKIASDVLGMPVTEASSVEDVPGWDSLKMLQIVMALDEAGISVPLEKIAEVRSVGDLIRFSGQSHA
ncbi:MAG: acyl carrier protein [Synergistaceae bacterium]|nr:acyl carrier protein [Synergistaceae bacterium]